MCWIVTALIAVFTHHMRNEKCQVMGFPGLSAQEFKAHM